MRVAVAIFLLILIARPATAQHLGTRVQWQPETADPDARLEQPVGIEILGRAAVPALEILSKATGVSLTVAPEDIDTVGERKLTIISNGLTLEATMVQLPEALQECHWDIDDSGDEPVYLLHRNAGADAAADERPEPRIIRSPDRLERTNRVADAERALAMSPSELAKLEETDPFLSRAVRHPEARVLMESFVNLPQERMDELLLSGRTRMSYAEAPQDLRTAATVAIALQRRWAEWARSWPPDMDPPEEFDPTNMDLQLSGLEQDLRHGGSDIVVLFHVTASQGAVMTLAGPNGSTGQTVVPARPPIPCLSGNYYEFLLTETGDDLAGARATTDRFTAEWDKQWSALDWVQSERSWVEPPDSRLQEVVEFPSDSGNTIPLVAAQQMIAERTGLSVISDYFSDDLIQRSPDQPALGGPLWRDLYVLGKIGGFAWRLVGDCLVFRHTSWYHLARWELPETLLRDYRKRLARHGHFVLDDVVEFAVEIEGLPRACQYGGPRVPRDLVAAGLFADRSLRGPLLLYHSLTPDEQACARNPGGLALAELVAKGRQDLLPYVPVPGTNQDESVRRELTRSATLLITESAGAQDGVPYTEYLFTFTFPDDADVPEHVVSTAVRLPQIAPAEIAGESEATP